MEIDLAKSESMGRWIYASTIGGYILCFCMVFPSASSEPWGELARGIAILIATALLGLGSILASVLLYRNGCRNRLHFVPFGLFALWIAIFAPLFIGKPYYWGSVTFLNKSSTPIWIENHGEISAHSCIGGSGVGYGNSNSITFVWWYGRDRNPPIDKSQVFRYVVKPQTDLPRGSDLFIKINEKGEWSIESDPYSKENLSAY